MNCFDVFIIVLVTVIFLVVYLHHDHLVTTFELSHILTNTLNNVFYFLSEINIFNKLISAGLAELCVKLSLQFGFRFL